ncbi:MAG: hypothetical protein ACW98D_17110 [Promethearchaeota archaeon]|jgi:hypothetical protein
MELSHKNPIEIKEDRVIKTFNPRFKKRIKSHEDAFTSELTAYKYFNKIRWAWAPRLLAFDTERKQLKIQRINGSSLSETIKNNLTIDIPYVIDQLVELDRSLWIHRINCLHICSDDILLEKNTSKVYLVDYEYTLLRSRFKIILCDQILSSKIFKIQDQMRDCEFVNVLKNSRSRFYKYKIRRIYFLYTYFIHRFVLRKKRHEFLL